MDWKLSATVFATVFLAEIGDKTQVATLLYAGGAADKRWAVFAGSALALVAASALGVLAGSKLGPLVEGPALRWIAGIGFLAVGAWTILKG